MADGMPPHFLQYLLNERQGFARHGKLLTATLWLQSQMVSLICLHENPQLIKRIEVENGRHFPFELAQASIGRLEDLSSGSLREKFLEYFGTEMSDELKDDVARSLLDRDALSHGYVSLFLNINDQTKGRVGVPWSPRPNRKREAVLDNVLGPRPDNTYFMVSLSDQDFEDELERICRVMDFIAHKVTGWGIPYAVFS